MGGPGSGNWDRWNKKDVVENYTALDVNQWVREGIIKEGRVTRGKWSFRQSGGTTRTIWYEVRMDESSPHILLHNTVNGREGGGCRILLDRTYPFLGGVRWWFVCPGEGCGRRVGKLYGCRDFLCRHCRNLIYESQRKPASFRALSRAQKIRRRLCGYGGLLNPFPDKPKGMHWEMYLRLQDEAIRAEDQGWTMVNARIGELRKRLERI